MKSISLTQGYFAIVDDADFERVSQLRWHVHIKRGRPYAKRGIYSPEKQNNDVQYLHTFILGLGPNQPADHRNGNGLDCRRENLRVATQLQNNRAFRKKAPGKTSRFRGVFWNTQVGKWQARLTKFDKQYHLGTFVEEELAAKAYDLAALKHFGDFAAPNFPSI